MVKDKTSRLVVAPMIMPPKKALRQAVAAQHRWLPSGELGCSWCGMTDGHTDDCELARLFEEDEGGKDGREN